MAGAFSGGGRNRRLPRWSCPPGRSVDSSGGVKAPRQSLHTRVLSPYRVELRQLSQAPSPKDSLIRRPSTGRGVLFENTTNARLRDTDSIPDLPESQTQIGRASCRER